MVDNEETENPEIAMTGGGAKAHHKIQAVEVSGGFLDGARLEFVDGLNCIIGGRGTGKTTVLEFIRYILGLMPDPAEGKPRAKAVEGIVRGNLGSGTIRLDVETKHGTRYRAERPWDDSAQILDADGEPVAVSLDRDLVFKADIYSQNEIEEIATNPRFQLSLIDKFEEEAVREASTEIQKLKRAIEQSAVDLRLLDRNIREIEDVVPEIDIVGKRLKEMQVVEGPEADLINTAHTHKALRTRESEAVRELQAVVGEVADDFERFAARVSEECQNALGEGFAESPNAAIFEEVSTLVSEFVGVFRDAVPKIQGRCDKASEGLANLSRRLQDEHARQEQQYREIVARSAQEQERATERARLQQRHFELSKARSELDALKQKRKALEGDHRRMTSELSDLRDRRFGLRKAVAERLTAALAPRLSGSASRRPGTGQATKTFSRKPSRAPGPGKIIWFRGSSKACRPRNCRRSSGKGMRNGCRSGPGSAKTRRFALSATSRTATTRSNWKPWIWAMNRSSS